MIFHHVFTYNNIDNLTFLQIIIKQAESVSSQPTST